MKISSLKLKNFRSYRDEVEIKFENFTALIGKNDAGKSTILDALDIFFNDKKIEADDVNVNDKDSEVVIALSFKDLPSSITLDSVETSLESEYLLNANGELEIIKKYSPEKIAKIYIKANHPTRSECADLLLKKQAELQEIIINNNISGDKKTNSKMRQAIWQHFSNNLDLQEIEIEANKEDAKNLWEKIKKELPLYTLFKADRENSDKDEEIQDPIKSAVREFLEKDTNITEHLNIVADKVIEQISKISNNTLEKLKQLDSAVASELNARIDDKERLKWWNVFKEISITDENNIAINKRGSGVRRLILLSFFRAKAEENTEQNTIYAIEEPETSQQASNQELLIKALKELSNKTQILITTHSSIIVKNLEKKDIRIIVSNQNQEKSVIETDSLNKLVISPLSLNEINYLVFDDISEVYHDELYPKIPTQKKDGRIRLCDDFINLSRERSSEECPLIKKYIDNRPNKAPCDLTLTEYIRYQIHHPENTLNKRFTQEDLRKSIELMRDFLNNTKDI